MSTFNEGTSRLGLTIVPKKDVAAMLIRHHEMAKASRVAAEVAAKARADALRRVGADGDSDDDDDDGDDNESGFGGSAGAGLGFERGLSASLLGALSNERAAVLAQAISALPIEQRQAVRDAITSMPAPVGRVCPGFDLARALPEPFISNFPFRRIALFHSTWSVSTSGTVHAPRCISLLTNPDSPMCVNCDKLAQSEAVLSIINNSVDEDLHLRPTLPDVHLSELQLKKRTTVRNEKKNTTKLALLDKARSAWHVRRRRGQSIRV
jgi:hypothetical protein